VPGLEIKASSSNSDGKHKPENIFEDDDKQFWSSQPDVKHVELEMEFVPLSIGMFTISWKYFPSEFEIHARTKDYWRTIQHVKDNEDEISVF